MSEQAEMIPAGIAMVKVLEAWGVDHLYGIPGGSFNSTMDALLAEKDNIQYIQVRHEEVGAMAAAADAKLTGKIGVAFGSAGPGGTHLLNGLYDAREDHVPVLALIGQFGTSGMNMDTFQEMNENPIYADVSVYNVTAVTAQSLPHLIDEAIRRAYAQHGVAVVQIPVDLPWQDIPAESWYASANSYQQPLLPQPDPDKVKQIATNKLNVRLFTSGLERVALVKRCKTFQTNSKFHWLVLIQLRQSYQTISHCTWVQRCEWPKSQVRRRWQMRIRYSSLVAISHLRKSLIHSRIQSTLCKLILIRLS